MHVEWVTLVSWIKYSALVLLHLVNKKHLKNVGPIRHCEPPLHYHSPRVASCTPTIAIAQAACDVHDDDNDNAWRGDRYGPMEWAQWCLWPRQRPLLWRHVLYVSDEWMNWVAQRTCGRGALGVVCIDESCYNQRQLRAACQQATSCYREPGHFMDFFL